MNKKTVIIIIVVAILALIAYHMYKSRQEAAAEAAVAANIFGAPAPTAQQPKAPAAAAGPPAIPEAVSQAQQLIDKYSADINAGHTENGNAYLQRGLAYLSLKQPREAIEDFTSALKSAPKSPLVLYSRALAYRQENLLDKATTDLAAAIAVKPDYAEAYNVSGLIHVDQLFFNQALADYQKAIVINPKYTDAYYNLGALYAKLKNYADAKTAFTNAISTNVPPANASKEDIAAAREQLMQTYLSRATVESAAGDYKDALADATYVITNDPNSVKALKVRAGIYDSMGNSAAAAIDEANANNLSMQNMLNDAQ